MISGTITLNDKEYPIKLGTLAFSILEEKTGIDNPFAVLSDGKKLRSAKHLQALVFGAIRCGCILEDKPCDITYDQVGAYMKPKDIDSYLMKVIETFDIPTEEEANKKKEMKASR
jgi:hypothetical protein